MKTSDEFASKENSSRSSQHSDGLEASAVFSLLDKSRQVLVFKTIQEAISAVPPRQEATFPRVVAAYTSLTKVVGAAAHGQLLENDLARLESDIDAAGGVIAPGLWSQGDNSIAAFRAATFGALRNTFQPPVVDAALAALNAKLSILKLNDLGHLFHAIASFFYPLSLSGSNMAKLGMFNSLDIERQVLVFRTIQDASLANPQRSEATFGAVVDAFHSEVKLLKHACGGSYSDDLLIALESSIEAAGGVLSPSTYASGKRSIASFRTETFKALQPLLSEEVATSAVSALNARLRYIRPNSLPSLFTEVQGFFAPLLSHGQTSPTIQNFKSLTPDQQSLVFRTIETAISSKPELESTIFSSAVHAICTEQEIVQAASSGHLAPELLSKLKTAIDQCGGFMEPALKSEGEDSVGELIHTYFSPIQREIPAEVSEAAIAALNAKLKTASVTSFLDIVQETRDFLDPIISVLNTISLQPSSSTTATTDTLAPAGTDYIENVYIMSTLEQETQSPLSEIDSVESCQLSNPEKLQIPSIATPFLSERPEGEEEEFEKDIIIETEDADSGPSLVDINDPTARQATIESAGISQQDDPPRSLFSNAQTIQSQDHAISEAASTSHSSKFAISWVLVNELSLGPAPTEPRHLNQLKAEGVAAILSLCSTQEKAPADGMDLLFHCRRVVLPEQRHGGLPSLEQLEAALTALGELLQYGPVFVHCVAAVERSPLICLAWLMRQHQLSQLAALDYLLQIHPGTSPSSSQLSLLNQLPGNGIPLT